MKLLIEKDDRSQVEVREIEDISADADVLLFFMAGAWKTVDIEAMEEYITRKVGKKCVLLDYRFQKVVGVKA